MKVVYVVVSTTGDTYYEQTLISAISLKKHNPAAQVYFLVDQDTARTLTGKRTLHEKLGVTVITVDVPTDMPNMQRSRFIKTSMNRWVEGSFFYIDGDTMICDTLDGMDETIDVGMVADGHVEAEKHVRLAVIKKHLRKANFPFEFFDGNYYNGGFMWYSGSMRAERLLGLWHELWLKGYKKMPSDQSYLNEANRILRGAITEVSGIWNCQVNLPHFIKYVFDAKVLHYFSTDKTRTYYDLVDKTLQKTVLDATHDRLDAIIEKPKSGFGMMAETESAFQRYSIYNDIRWLYNNFHLLFCVFDFLSHCFFFVPKTLKHLMERKR